MIESRQTTMDTPIRKDNWEEAEIKVLIFAYYDRVEILEAKFSTSIPNSDKATAG